MGDKNQGRLMTVPQPEQKVHDGLAIGLIQVACGLICQQDIRSRCHRPGQSHALLFSARHLAWKVIGAVSKAHGLKLGFGAFEGVFVTCQLQWRCDVFQGGHRRDQVKALKHHTHVIAAETGEGIFVHGAQVLAQGADGSAGCALKPAHQHQERGFARPRRANQPQSLSFCDVKRDAMQYFYTTGIAFQRETGIFEGENGRHMETLFMRLLSQYGGLRDFGKAMALVLMSAVPAKAQDLAILAFGDSLTHGYGLIEQEGFVPQMRGWLEGQGVELRLVNAGVSGDTTAGGAARIDWSLTEDIDGIMLALGANDMLRGIDPASSRENLAKIIEAAQARDVPVLLIGFQASNNFGPDYKAAFDGMYPELAAEYGTLYAEHFFDGLQSDDPSEVAAWMQPDGLHPNGEGVALIVSALGPKVLELIEAAKAE